MECFKHQFKSTCKLDGCVGCACANCGKYYDQHPEALIQAGPSKRCQICGNLENTPCDNEKHKAWLGGAANAESVKCYKDRYDPICGSSFCKTCRCKRCGGLHCNHKDRPLPAFANTAPSGAEHDGQYHQPARRSALQDWVMGLTIMQQSVLIAAIRGPDGIRKNHPVKLLCRWLRRCVLISAFDRAVIANPWSQGGGSFTGPSMDVGYLIERVGELSFMDWRPKMKKLVSSEYLQHVDELPHHFQLHFMHAAEIIGYKHPDAVASGWWNWCYLELVNDMHLIPETEEQMDTRLGDNEKAWRDREHAPAKQP